METRDGHQKGPQQHAEGQHGEKTHARFLEQIHHPMGEGDDSENDGESEINDEGSGNDRQRR